MQNLVYFIDNSPASLFPMQKNAQALGMSISDSHSIFYTIQGNGLRSRGGHANEERFSHHFLGFWSHQSRIPVERDFVSSVLPVIFTFTGVAERIEA